MLSVNFSEMPNHLGSRFPLPENRLSVNESLAHSKCPSCSSNAWWTELCPQIQCVEVLTPGVTVSGDGIFRMEIKWDCKGRAPIQEDEHPSDTRDHSPQVHAGHVTTQAGGSRETRKEDLPPHQPWPMRTDYHYSRSSPFRPAATTP